MKTPFHFQGNESRAYILLEVMLATAIFSMAAVALAVLLNEAMQSFVRLQRDTRATLSLESQMDEARVNRLVAGKEMLPPDIHGIAYSKEVLPLNLKTNKNQLLTGLYEVRITASWKDGGHDETEVSQTYVYQP